AAAGKVPLFVATDQEGGPVNRLLPIVGSLPAAADVAATGDPNFARQRGGQDGQALYNLGITMDLAPAVDVQNDGRTAGGQLNGRMFGSTPDQVIKFAGAYLTGLQENHHVVGALKHFPGLGDVPIDPHQQLYTSYRSLADLQKIDWAPYKALIASG